ncbi:hypothetical protein [Kordiimonas pumila]|uniref:Lipoprotein n=1 Tax=Kordiimonas pumila TaxID=2161677 RepID=A0ABV7D9P4_9PROT|nr:hypothetical protein [Kordiimonas pumila]
MKKTLSMLALAFTVTGCVNTSSSLERETARFVGDVSPEAITVLNIDRGMLSVKWDARVKDGRVYRCDADDMMKRVHCVQQ